MTNSANKDLQLVCSQCNRSVCKDGMIRYQDRLICSDCKPLVIQKIKEGVELDPVVRGTIGWKIFFFIILSLQMLSFTDSIQNIIIAKDILISLLDLIIYPLVLVAIFGFSFRKKILHRTVWKILFPVVLLYDVVVIANMFINSDQVFDTLTLAIIYLVLSPLMVFQYIALYKYAFSKIIPWE
jgi:hypothetical protein